MQNLSKEQRDAIRQSVQQYVDFVNDNTDLICREVDSELESSKDFIKKEILECVSSLIHPIPMHYERYFGDCPYDDSGNILPDGRISLYQTIKDFLENEYVGTREATYVSHFGFNYPTYDKVVSEDTLNIATTIMSCTIQNLLEKHFNTKLSDDEIEIISGACCDFEDVYVGTHVSDFFYAEYAVEFCGIADTMLYTLAHNDRIPESRKTNLKK